MRTSLFLAAAVAQLLAQASGAAAQAPAPTPAERVDGLFQRWGGETPGCAVGVDGPGFAPVRRAYGLAELEHRVPATVDTIYEAGSVAKQFTAAAVLKLEEAGKLSVGDPIARYFDGVPADKAAITIHHLLSHQAGFPGAIGDDRDRVGRDEFVRQALATPLLFAPGTGYEYSNVGFSLAAAIVEKVAGTSYEAFAREALWLPAGMRDTGTTTSSLILPGASVRSAGDSALRAAHRRSRDASSAASSSDTSPSPAAARISASTSCGSVSASPSASIISSAPASAGRSAPPTSRASCTACASMNSSIDGVTGCAISRATACAALSTSR